MAGSSGSCAKPTESCVSADAYPVASTDSNTRMRSTRSQIPALDQSEQVEETGVHSGTEDGDAADARGRVESLDRLRAECPTGDERRGRHDVDAGGEDAAHLVDVGPHRVVAHAVGREREQGVDVVRRFDPDRVAARERADVDPDLVGRPRVAPDEVETGVAHDRPRRPAADVAGRPLHDPKRHGENVVDRIRGRFGTVRPNVARVAGDIGHESTSTLPGGTRAG